MPSPPVRTANGVEHDRSRQLISDSRALIAHARELIRQSQWRISQAVLCQDGLRLVPADHPVAAR